MKSERKGRASKRKPDGAPASSGLYAAGLFTSLTGVAAISLAVGSAVFLAAISILIAVGYFVSMRLRAAGRNPQIIEVMVVAICLATYARLFSPNDGNPILSPGIAMYHKELSLAVMLVWAEVARSFALILDEAVLFSAVPSLALIGVVATTSPGPFTLVFFALWLIGSVTMFVEAGQAERAKDARFKSLWLAGGLGIGATAAGMLISPVLHSGSLSALMAVAPGVYANRQAAEVVAGAPAGNVLPISHGPIRLSSREVMRVQSDIGGYWRGRVWTSYTGRDWTSSAAAETAQPVYRRGRGVAVYRAQTLLPPSDGRRELVQRYSVTSAPEPYLFAAAELVEIRADLLGIQRDRFNCWRFTPAQMGMARMYTVISSVPDAAPRDLRRAPREYPRRMSRYLQTPLAADRVKELARQVAAKERNPYDRVVALQHYLWDNCTYDLQAPRLPVTEDDAVSYFLFATKRGYCDMFASSLAIMARCVGVPTRLATGYAQGEHDPETGEWIVRDRDRHSWVEVYFPGYGWVPFEATPAGQIPEAGFWTSVWREARMLASDPTTRTLLLIAALSMAVAALRMVTGSRPATDPFARHERRLRPNARRAQDVWRRLARLLRGHGVTAGRSVTPMELFWRADAALPPEADREPLRRALELVTRELYSGHAEGGGSAEEMEAAFREAARDLGRIQRRLFKRARNG